MEGGRREGGGREKGGGRREGRGEEREKREEEEGREKKLTHSLIAIPVQHTKVLHELWTQLVTG